MPCDMGSGMSVNKENRAPAATVPNVDARFTQLNSLLFESFKHKKSLNHEDLCPGNQWQIVYARSSLICAMVMRCTVTLVRSPTIIIDAPRTRLRCVATANRPLHIMMQVNN
jgi:hypothetical protein